MRYYTGQESRESKLEPLEEQINDTVIEEKNSFSVALGIKNGKHLVTTGKVSRKMKSISGFLLKGPLC